MKTSLLQLGGAATCLASTLLVGILCAAKVFSADVTIAWDATSEPDIRGYNIYYQMGTDGPPYYFLENVALQGIDPGSPSVEIKGLDDGTYYLVVSAVDTEGLESLYSNSVCTQISDGTAQPCGSNSGDSVGSGGGGGGGGCLIDSLQIF
jgi:hypothetical protein